MYYNTLFVGMDVHKETFTLCCYTNEKEKAEYPQKVDGHYIHFSSAGAVYRCCGLPEMMETIAKQKRFLIK